MAGYSLAEGCYDRGCVSEEDIEDAIISFLSSNRNNDTTYKYGLLYSIMDNIEYINDNKRISFNRLFTSFTKRYWRLVVEHGLRQKAPTKDGRRSLVERILIDANEKYGDLSPAPFSLLPYDARVDIINKTKQECKKYVVGALFVDTNRLLYSFSKKEEWIELNPVAFTFLCQHKDEMLKLNDNEWAKFLEKINKGWDKDTIIKQCFLKDGSPNGVNTAESSPARLNNYVMEVNNYGAEDVMDADEEARKLLDDPEELIKLLMRRKRT